MGDGAGGLCVLGQFQRRAHLTADGLHHFAVTLLVDSENALQQRDAFVLGRLRKTLEGAARGGDSLIDICCGA